MKVKQWFIVIKIIRRQLESNINQVLVKNGRQILILNASDETKNVTQKKSGWNFKKLYIIDTCFSNHSQVR